MSVYRADLVRGRVMAKRNADDALGRAIREADEAYEALRVAPSLQTPDLLIAVDATLQRLAQELHRAGYSLTEGDG